MAAATSQPQSIAILLCPQEATHKYTFDDKMSFKLLTDDDDDVGDAEDGGEERQHQQQARHARHALHRQVVSPAAANQG